MGGNRSRGGNSTRVAVGGVFSALCLLLMFMTGLLPFASYALPALAGAMLVAVVIENGPKAALLVYISVSVLSLLIVPDREAALIFIVFFGYYPIAKARIEKIRSHVLEYACKLVLFNGAVCGSYYLAAQIFGLEEFMEGLGDFGRYSVLVILLLANAAFVLYDLVLSRYITLYVKWFRPTFLKR